MYVLISLLALTSSPSWGLTRRVIFFSPGVWGMYFSPVIGTTSVPSGTLIVWVGDRLGVALDEQLDLDRLVGEAAGDELAPDLELVLDEDGRAGDEVADGDVLRAAPAFSDAEADGHDRHLLALQLAGRDQGGDAGVEAPVGAGRSCRDPLARLAP